MPDHTELPAPGDHIWIRREAWVVRSTTRGHGLHRVTATAIRPPTRTGAFLLPVEPWTRERTGHTRRVSARQGLARLAACAAHIQPAFTPSTIVASGARLLPYQLEPALAVLASVRRVLIADAVGLGKTVQAGLIVSETLASHVDARVLVIVPAPLTEQWIDELKAHFGLVVRMADATAFNHLRAEAAYLANPWNTPGIWLTSPDFLKQPHILEAVPATAWDVLVIDEAHTMSGDSQRRAAAHALAQQARHVVLLTATPDDGDPVRFNRLLTIGASGPHDRLVVFRRLRASADRRVRRLHIRPPVETVRALAAIDRFAGTAEGALPLICAIFRKRLLSSTASLTASVNRRMDYVTGHTHEDSSESWTQLMLYDSDEVPRDEIAALSSDTGLPHEEELAWLTRLRFLAAAAGHASPKLRRLSALLRRAGEPAIVFTEYRDTLRAAAAALEHEHRVCLLHGGQSPRERRQALKAFADGRARVLLATDVASQGLNLQHRARWVINLDLPWTPVKLEQRTGRVDRFGQTRTVHVTVLALRHPADAALHDRLMARGDRGDDPSLKTCRRWTRAAMGLARLFGRQRALAAQWRGPMGFLSLPCANVSASQLRRLCGTAAAPVTVLEVPLQTSDGTVLEKGLGLHDASSTPAGAAWQRRARTLQARLRVRHGRVRRQTVTAPPTGAATQPGLFDSTALERSRARSTEAAPSMSLDPVVQPGVPRAVLRLHTGAQQKVRR